MELTENHKIKLLEMITKLFPQYVKVSFCVDSSDYDQSEYEKCLQLFTVFDLDGQEWSEIHWFEFIMLKLTPKILPSFNDMEEFYSGLNGLDEVPSHKKHPIDYLYEEFKKLNYEKTKT